MHRLAVAVRTAPRRFPDLAAAVAYYHVYLAPFGDLSAAEWEHLARYNLQQLPDGSWHKRSDPEITASFNAGWLWNLSLWTYWDTITCPTLVLRGAESDLLLPGTAAEMTRRGPHAKLIEIPGCGHAPPLLSDDQVDIVSGWLQAAGSLASR